MQQNPNVIKIRIFINIDRNRLWLPEDAVSQGVPGRTAEGEASSLRLRAEPGGGATN